MATLFEAAGLEKSAPRPLADRLRPKTLAEVVGQEQLVGPEGTLTRMLGSGRLPSLILWGPPGSGQDDGRAAARQRDAARVRAALRHLLGRAGPAQGLRPRQGPARAGTRHAAFHRRDPPLQPRPAGQLSAAHGGRHHHPRRCDDREPFLRAQRRVAEPRAPCSCSTGSTRRRWRSFWTRAEQAEKRRAAARRGGARDADRASPTATGAR